MHLVKSKDDRSIKDHLETQHKHTKIILVADNQKMLAKQQNVTKLHFALLIMEVGSIVYHVW